MLFKKKLRLLVVAVVLSMFAAACGSTASDVADEVTDAADAVTEEVEEAIEDDDAEGESEDDDAEAEAEAETTTTAPPVVEGGPGSLIISTASTGGTYFPVGVAISTLTNVNLGPEGIQMNAISSAGSGENVSLLKNGEVDLAIIQGLVGSMAWNGQGSYDEPEQTLRSISMLWENVEHMTIATEFVSSGDMSDMDNLEGESFSIGSRGSGTETSGTTILGELGYVVDDHFSPERIGYSESSSALQDGRISGMNTPAGPPVSAVTQAFATLGDDITLLEFTDEQLEQVNTTFPVWSRFVIPAGTYPGIDEDVNTIAQPNFLAVHPDLDEETVYQITKNIHENVDFLINIHPATAAISLDRAVNGLPVPLHPGAIRYYDEVGVEIPDELRG